MLTRKLQTEHGPLKETMKNHLDTKSGILYYKVKTDIDVFNAYGGRATPSRQKTMDEGFKNLPKPRAGDTYTYDAKEAKR